MHYSFDVSPCLANSGSIPKFLLQVSLEGGNCGQDRIVTQKEREWEERKREKEKGRVIGENK